MIDINDLLTNNATLTEDADGTDIKSLLKAVDSAARINGTSTFVVDFDAHKLIYRTEHLVYIEETTTNDQKRNCAIPYWSIISEETTEKLLLIKDHYL